MHLVQTPQFGASCCHFGNAAGATQNSFAPKTPAAQVAPQALGQQLYFGLAGKISAPGQGAKLNVVA